VVDPTPLQSRESKMVILLVLQREELSEPSSESGIEISSAGWRQRPRISLVALIRDRHLPRATHRLPTTP
jgi:hypothetical protein